MFGRVHNAEGGPLFNFIIPNQAIPINDLRLTMTEAQAAVFLGSLMRGIMTQLPFFEMTVMEVILNHVVYYGLIAGFEMMPMTTFILNETPVDIDDVYQMLRYWAFVQSIITGLRHIVGDWNTLKTLLITPAQAQEWYARLPQYGVPRIANLEEFLREINADVAGAILADSDNEELLWDAPVPPSSPLLPALEYPLEIAVANMVAFEHSDSESEAPGDAADDPIIIEDDEVQPRDQNPVQLPPVEEVIEVNMYGAEEGSPVHHISNSTVHLQSPSVVINATDFTLVIRTEQPALGAKEVMDVLSNPEFLGEEFAQIMRDFAKKKWEGVD